VRDDNLIIKKLKDRRIKGIKDQEEGNAPQNIIKASPAEPVKGTTILNR
jgi:hypothetical protein